MTEVARELTRLAARVAGRPTPPPSTPAPEASAPSPTARTLPGGPEPAAPRRSRAPLVVVALILVAAGLGALLLLQKPASPADPLAANLPIPAVTPQLPAIEVPPKVAEPEVPKVSLTSVPEGASVTHAGKRLGATPLTIELPRGRPLTVRLSLAGYKSVRRKLAPSDGAIAVQLEKAAPGEKDDGFTKVNDLKDDPYE